MSPFLLQGQQHYAATSVGISYAIASDSHDLTREADIAMYAAKRQGGSKAVVFEIALHDAAVSTMRIEQDLFRAFENDEFEIYYQPLVTLPDRKIAGFEALLRWRHPARGWISPARLHPGGRGKRPDSPSRRMGFGRSHPRGQSLVIHISRPHPLHQRFCAPVGRRSS